MGQVCEQGRVRRPLHAALLLLLHGHALQQEQARRCSKAGAACDAPLLRGL